MYTWGEDFSEKRTATRGWRRCAGRCSSVPVRRVYGCIIFLRGNEYIPSVYLLALWISYLRRGNGSVGLFLVGRGFASSVCVCFFGFHLFFSTLRGRDFSINMNEMVSVFCLVSIGVFFRFRRGDRMYMIIFCRKKFI